MLPERLSTDLTSLGEGEERLAIVVEMTVGGDGAVTRSDVYRAVVVNHAKLAYDAVAAWLDGAAPAPPGVAAVPGLDEQLRLQDGSRRRLRRLRDRARRARPRDDRGAAGLRGRRRSTALRPDEKNRAKALIEDFMIAANGVTARFLEREGLPVAAPRPALARALGADRRARRRRWASTLPAAAERPRARGASSRARRGADPLRFPDLSLSVVKLLGVGRVRASSVPGERPTGHFGLAVRDYTHSTAPNRRFPDLITQRLLKAALAGGAPPYARRRARRARPALHRAGGRTRPRSSGRCASPRPRCCSRRASASGSTPS